MDKTVAYHEKKTNRAKLIIWNRKNQIAEKNIGDRCLIGRKTDDSVATVQIDSALVSRKHGEIFCKDGEFYYRDLNSLNGIFINGCYIGKEANLIKLRNGDVLKIDYEHNRERHKDAIVMVFMSALEYENEWDSLSLGGNVSEINIGRDYSSINISSNLVSKKHGTFYLANKGWAIKDNNSTNGVFLNGIKIEKPSYLYPMDVVRMGNLLFFYDGGQLWYPIEKVKKEIYTKKNVTNEKKLMIDIKDRTVRHNFKKITLLEDIRLSVNSGEMVLILGGSGAGKTTFMNYRKDIKSDRFCEPEGLELRIKPLIK